jgi:serine phosphatase RsbU (regulator of sigma subunit)
VLLVIGDVSGHGLRAATTMASLRHAALAYAAQECAPGTVLAKLSDFVNQEDHNYFATVLCALIDVDAHRLTIAGAGHMAPLLIDGDDGRFVELKGGVPIGVPRDSPYRENERLGAVHRHADSLYRRSGRAPGRGSSYAASRLRNTMMTPR